MTDIYEAFDESRWFNWQQAATPWLLSGCFDACAQFFPSYFGIPFFTSVLYYRRVPALSSYQASWLLRYDEGVEVGRQLTDLLNNEGVGVNILSAFEDSGEFFIQTRNNLYRSHGVTDLGPDALEALISDVVEHFNIFYGIGCITEPIQWFAEMEVQRTLLEDPGRWLGDSNISSWPRSRLNEALLHAGSSYTYHIHQDLVRILTLAKDHGIELASLSGIEKVDTSQSAVVDAIRDHLDAWGWKANNYARISRLTIDDVIQELIELGDADLAANTLAEQAGRISALDHDSAALLTELGDTTLAHIVRSGRNFGTALADRRKVIMNQALEVLSLVSQELCKVTGLPPRLAEFLTLGEAREAMRSTDPELWVDRLEDRENAYVQVLSTYQVGSDTMPEPAGFRPADLRTSSTVAAEGESAYRLLMVIDSAFGLLLRGRNLWPLKGQIAYAPAGLEPIVGTCRLVVDPREVDFQDDEILVATSTTPDFMPILRRASAIVTDQRGLTTHAAIVAKELQTPCIVGTIFATRAIRDGDTVRLVFKDGAGEVELVRAGE